MRPVKEGSCGSSGVPGLGTGGPSLAGAGSLSCDLAVHHFSSAALGRNMGPRQASKGVKARQMFPRRTTRSSEFVRSRERKGGRNEGGRRGKKEGKVPSVKEGRLGQSSMLRNEERYPTD